MLNVIDKKLRKVQFISGNTLKIIACVCMFIDHFIKNQQYFNIILQM